MLWMVMEIQPNPYIFELGLSKLLFMVVLSWLSCCLVAEGAIGGCQVQKKKKALDTKDWKC